MTQFHTLNAGDQSATTGILGMSTTGLPFQNGVAVNSVQTLDTGLTNCLPYFQTYATASPYFPLQIRAVKNGYIVSINGHEHVFTDPDEVGKFIAKQVTEFYNPKK